MAYLELTERFSTAHPPVPFTALQPEREIVDGFSGRDWAVVRLAREDPLSSLRGESEFKRFLRLIFGFERKRPLTDPKLEALRRIAVLSWHYSYNVASSEIDAFFAAGYSIDQYEAMLAHIGHERAASARRPRR